ncbi:hypothetical protein [Tissierella praeacuta]|uniref:hypothetical protein n=1 Tax=Tissierella praeacuta TaxID=43131 RepID=UPI0028A59D3F|nr:hypothetical protein [Tissierella praeacuta]
MIKRWSISEDVIKEFKDKNSDRFVDTLAPEIIDINPQNIIAINRTYKYPEILNDYKMQILKKSVCEKGWTNEKPHGFCLLMFPNGDLVVAGAGNHRAVLSRELSISSVKASVAKVIYCD